MAHDQWTSVSTCRHYQHRLCHPLFASPLSTPGWLCACPASDTQVVYSGRSSAIPAPTLPRTGSRYKVWYGERAERAGQGALAPDVWHHRSSPRRPATFRRTVLTTCGSALLTQRYNLLTIYLGSETDDQPQGTAARIPVDEPKHPAGVGGGLLFAKFPTIFSACPA